MTAATSTAAHSAASNILLRLVFNDFDHIIVSPVHGTEHDIY